MILYHGSNIEIHEIDFSKSKLGKDFGCGFYLSPTLEQARDMAEKKSLLLGGEPVITSFEFDIENPLNPSNAIQQSGAFSFKKTARIKPGSKFIHMT